MTASVGPRRQYEEFADDFLDHARRSLYNAHYDRPACLELLGDVAGRRVLDAACGPGLYAQALVEGGAEVIGFDQSPRMVELCRQRVPGAKFRVHDLAHSLDWLPDASIDLALLALAIDYVDDRVSALRELRRVLRPGGALVLSRGHPAGDWMRNGGDYYEARVVEEVWSRGWEVRYWIMPLERVCDELHEAGFLMERLREPRPTPEAAELDPERYARLSREPTGFIAIRAVPRPRPTA